MNLGVKFSREVHGNWDKHGETLALGRVNVPSGVIKAATFRGFLSSIRRALKSE
jgi:hypothetical protein